MNAEAQVTVGTELLHAGYSITEAHGDQPGAARRARRRGARHRLRAGGLRQPQGLPRPRPEPRVDALLVAEAGEHALGRHLLHRRRQDADRAGAGRERARRRHRAAGHDRRRRSTTSSTSATSPPRPTRIGRPVSDYVVHPKGPKGVLILATCEAAELTPDYSVFAKVRTRDGRAYVLREAALLRPPRGAEDPARRRRRGAAGDHQRPRPDGARSPRSPSGRCPPAPGSRPASAASSCAARR